MRTILNLLVLCLFLNSCNQERSIKHSPFSSQEEPNRGEVAIVYGKISNLQVYPHIKEVTLTLPDFSKSGEVHVSPIDSLGEFRFEIYPIVTREFSITPIEDRLLIAPGDTLFIEHDFADFTNTQFSGSAAIVNWQIAQFRNDYLGRYNFDYDLSYLDYKDRSDKQLNEYFKKLTAFQKEHNTSEQFNTWAEKQIRLDYFSVLIEFPFQHYIRTKEEFVEKDAYYRFLPELENIINETMILFSYFRVMERYNLMKKFDFNPVPKSDIKLTETESIDLLSSVSKNNFFSQFAVATQLSIGLKANTTEIIDENEEKINKIITNPFLRSVLQTEYNKVKDYKAKPKIFSDAVMGRDMLEKHGVGVHPQDSFNIVKRIIDKHIGQILFVDIWAPWCPPCIIEMPYSKTLSDYFSNKPVTFVYLNIGGTDEQWKETIDKHELSGIHSYLTEKEWIDVMNRFNAKSIPYYLLFDKEGVMVDFGSHLRPSIPGTKIAIEKLLE